MVQFIGERYRPEERTYHVQDTGGDEGALFRLISRELNESEINEVRMCKSGIKVIIRTKKQ